MRHAWETNRRKIKPNKFKYTMGNLWMIIRPDIYTLICSDCVRNQSLRKMSRV